jgi:hypothetical protein
MKTTIFILLTVFVYACTSNHKPEPPYMSLTAIKDVTDAHRLVPDPTAILSAFDLADNKSKAVEFKCTEITDQLLAPSVDLNLPDAAVAEKNNRNNEPMYRERTILQFMDTLRKVLATPVEKIDTVQTLHHSECFRTISNELTTLTQKQSQHKILWLFSNVQENSAILSVFDSNIKKAISSNPQTIIQQFEKTGLLPKDLSHITVVFSYLPFNREDSENFISIAEKIYKPLLEDRKATVVIQATNTFNPSWLK